MKQKNTILIIIGVLVIISVGFTAFYNRVALKAPEPIDSLPQNVTFSGVYVCLPHLNESESLTEECVFGLKTDDGEYYMVNFGARASAMEEFQSGKHITAEGFVVIKEALSTDQWVNYNMKGIFTITFSHQ